jgi:sec-independent protein translocase protein TatA
MMGLDNPLHIAFLLVLLLLVFGAKRLPEMGRSLGEGLRGFKSAVGGEPIAPTIAAQVGTPAAAPVVGMPAAAQVGMPNAVQVRTPAVAPVVGMPAAAQVTTSAAAANQTSPAHLTSPAQEQNSQ